MSTRLSHAVTLAVVLALCLVLPSALSDRVAAAPVQTAARPAAPAAVGETATYRVDMHFEQDGQRHVLRRYVDGARSRMEMDYDGEKVVTIELGDAARTTYTVMASQKQVMKFSAGTASAASGPSAVDAGAPATDDVEQAMELVGMETIDGMAAQKYAVRMGDGTGFLWLDASTELPVRMEVHGMRVEMKDYDFSAPAPELFELPRGYEVVDLNQMMAFSAGRMVIGGVAGTVGGHLGGEAGGSIGASVGGAFGGPIGSMVGRFIGQRIGRALGRRGATAAASPK